MLRVIGKNGCHAKSLKGVDNGINVSCVVFYYSNFHLFTLFGLQKYEIMRDKRNKTHYLFYYVAVSG